MLASVSSVEVRTARPVYFSDSQGRGVRMSVNKGRGYVTPTPAERVKVQRLAKGGYSIRCVGKGGFSRTLHVRADAYMVMVTEDGGFIHGTVSEVFRNASK